MDKNINFFQDKAIAFKKEFRQLFFLKIASLIFLVVYLLIIIATFSYSFILKKKQNILAGKIKKTKNQIDSFRSIETKQVYLKSKIKSLNNILADKQESQKITEAIFSLLSEGININSFAVTKDGQVSFNGQSSDFQKMKKFFSKLELTPQIGDMKIKRVKINGVSFNYKKGYTFGVYLFFET